MCGMPASTTCGPDDVRTLSCVIETRRMIDGFGKIPSNSASIVAAARQETEDGPVGRPLASVYDRLRRVANYDSGR